MIRQPSTPSQLLAHYRARLRGEEPPVHDGHPEVGWYRTRLVKGGPWVPVRIFREAIETDPDTGELTAPEKLGAVVDGMKRDPSNVWLWCEAITREEYEALFERRKSIPAMAATMAPLDLTKEAMRP